MRCQHTKVIHEICILKSWSMSKTRLKTTDLNRNVFAESPRKSRDLRFCNPLPLKNFSFGSNFNYIGLYT